MEAVTPLVSAMSFPPTAVQEDWARSGDQDGLCSQEWTKPQTWGFSSHLRWLGDTWGLGDSLGSCGR